MTRSLISSLCLFYTCIQSGKSVDLATAAVDIPSIGLSPPCSLTLILTQERVIRAGRHCFPPLEAD